MLILIFFRVMSFFLSVYIQYICSCVMKRNNNICTHKKHAFIFTIMLLYQIIVITDLANYGLSNSIIYWYYWDVLMLYGILFFVKN